ncbi:zinc metallopeptidase [Roseateles depolymerans]|uniref:Uncharacterized protein n=1 Tax=Roseateles depolymerans TaxID=76731 RepID=A0A0U3LVQ2_9BURK|nr:zinc metallopeptidase [Roseateles depolymerans]ALV09191.1 hypothetical protein RD2015_4753 [Roseateles depolymerans]REG13948.1 hypothetical protein DES44_3959 [Roseateles depolymerans]
MNEHPNEADLPRFWHMHGSARLDDYMLRLSSAKPPRFRIRNKDEVLDAFAAGPAFVGQGPIEIRALSGCPIPAFEVTAEDYHPSIVLMGPDFYSRALRDALDLPPDQIQYLPVDTTRCVRPFRAQDYRLAHVLAVGDVLDLSASGYEFGSGPGWDGHPIDTWRPRQLPPTPLEPIRYAPMTFTFREDATAPSALFISRWSGHLMVTDELAQKVLDAGLDDVQFQDITHHDPRGKTVRLKTRDGAEVVDYVSYSRSH